MKALRNNLFFLALAGSVFLNGCTTSLPDHIEYTQKDYSTLVELPVHASVIKSDFSVVDNRKWVVNGTDYNNINNYWITVNRPINEETKENTIGYLLVDLSHAANILHKDKTSSYIKNLVQDALNRAQVPDQQDLKIQISIDDLWISHGAVETSIVISLLMKSKQSFIEDIGYKYAIKLDITNTRTGKKKTVEVSDKFYESASLYLAGRQEEFANKMFQSLFDSLVKKLKEAKL